jgi:hypothetical protein
VRISAKDAGLSVGNASVIFAHERDEFRKVFIDVWRKVGQGAPLEPMEQTIAEVIGAHPEYQGILSETDSLLRDYPVEGEQTNPFLHMAMHIAIVEQITSDRPAGIRALYGKLRGSFHDTHELEHALMECLAQSLWESRESGQTPDENRYLSCVRRLQRRVL